ncbi:hypothetical protein SOPEG_1580 [Candidatus Sodalis pierantonius str. SOPE]|uniref:Uncharacterized protein n=1 Tax=Candidatus Sodalis pierantonii str. SOPE TaxID=2342 RepID=W0HIX7_9GAMM|nr:hypothetical protein [Candidatus Sodalis pierantonius]AHF73719.1 hypothetical protein SOPEG_1580 [Candidatus Sodalis pierantonius str. SOPE]
MGQVAFDTLQASEELQTAGLTSEQAKAISLVVRKSHEVADVATKRDLEDVHKDLTVQITDVRKDMDARFEKNEAQMQARFEKTDAQIADVRKDMEARFEKNEAQMQARFEKTEAQIALLRKDVEHTADGLLIKLSAVMLAIAGLASTIVTVVIKLL